MEGYPLLFTHLRQCPGEQVTVASAVCVIADGSIEGPVSGHTRLCGSHLLGREQLRGDAQLIQQVVDLTITVHGLRAAGQVQKALVVAIKVQVMLLFQSQKSLPTVDTQAQHGPFVEAKQARTPGVAQGGKHKLDGIHRRRHSQLEWAVGFQQPGQCLEDHGGISPGVNHAVRPLGGVAFAGLVTSKVVSLQQGYLMPPANQFPGGSNTDHTTPYHCDVHIASIS